MVRIQRREFLGRVAIGSAMLAGASLGARAQETAAPQGLRRIAKDVFIAGRDATGVFPGFVTYVHRTKPVLRCRFGWVDASDTYDNFHEMESQDNGRTWSEPKLAIKSHATDAGTVRYAENAAFFDEATGTLITGVSTFLYPKGQYDPAVPRQIEFRTSKPETGTSHEPVTTDFALPGGLGISFCFPLKTKAGRIVWPAIGHTVDDKGTAMKHPKSGAVISHVRMLLAEYNANGDIEWHVGDPLEASAEASTRGFSESTPVELKDGRIALLCRGSNAGAPELPGHKWLSFSDDGGKKWSQAVPLADESGAPVESSATGSACFRSIKNDKLYYVANLCLRGERADGNRPRSPLYIAEMREDPFAIRSDTAVVIDEKGGADTDQLQLSNFRFYQDRESGEIVLFVTRFGERDAKNWKSADHYRYRIALA